MSRHNLSLLDLVAKPTAASCRKLLPMPDLPDVLAEIHDRLVSNGHLRPARAVLHKEPQVKAGVLSLSASRTVRGRLEAIEGELVEVGLEEWERIKRVACWESYEREDGQEGVEDILVCRMPKEGGGYAILPVADLPDGWGIVARQGSNGQKAARTENGELLPPPIAVRLQGEGAVTREEVLRLAGKNEEADAEVVKDWHSTGRDERVYEENGKVVHRELGKAARYAR